MALLVQPLVGRAEELGTLEAAVSELERGRSRAIELIGEPGMGKTRLLAELEALADARGHLVLSGSASELEGELPFWVFVDALDEYVQALEPHRLEALQADTRAELPNVLPSLPRPEGAAPPPQIERYRTHRAVRELLEALAEPRPLVLLLDDLHWADSGSIELLGALLRRPLAAPVLLALAVRPRQVPERLAAPLDRAQRAGALARLDVHALSRDEARELVGPTAADALYADSGGNPFYLEQLARSGAAGASTGRDVTLAGVEVPRAVAASLAEELAALDATARRVLEGAAVAGDPFEPELAAAAAGVGDLDAVGALDDLLRRDLVRHTDVPRRFRFRHPLVRGAVYEGVPGGRRLAAHERCADALAARGASAVARAHHVEHAARHGDMEAIAVLREAGEEVAQRTPAGAARWFAGALRLLPADAPPEPRIGLLMASAGAQAAAGRFADAHAALLEALELAPPQELGLRVQLTVACAGMEGLLSRRTDEQARLEGAIDALPDLASPLAVTLMLSLSASAVYMQDYARARDWAVRALEVAETLGDPAYVAHPAASCALTNAFLCDIAEAERHHAVAAGILDPMSDAEVAGHIAGLSQLSVSELYLDRFADGARHAERALLVARASGQVLLYPMLGPLCASFWSLLGRFREALDVVDGAIEQARLVGHAHGLAWALFTRAGVALEAGDVEAALAASEESYELTDDGQPGIVACYAGITRGLGTIAAGDPARGLALVTERGGGETLTMMTGIWRAQHLSNLTPAWLATGKHAQAERAASIAAEIEAKTQVPFAQMAARRAAAHLALHAGDAEAAAEHAVAAVAAGERSSAPVELAATRTLAGRALALAGRPDRAMGQLQEAAKVFDSLGAVRWRDEAERELRRLGFRGTHRRTRAGRSDAAGIEALTERELQVARLIVDRRTNPQIAAELYLSQKTVETHVRNLFHKLGVSSRVDVARAVERADREPFG